MTTINLGNLLHRYYIERFDPNHSLLEITPEVITLLTKLLVASQFQTLSINLSYPLDYRLYDQATGTVSVLHHTSLLPYIRSIGSHPGIRVDITRVLEPWMVSYLSELPRVTELHFSGCVLDIDNLIHSILHKLPGLERLRFNECIFNVPCTPSWALCATLQAVEFESNPNSPTPFEYVTPLLSSSTIVRLTIRFFQPWTTCPEPSGLSSTLRYLKVEDSPYLIYVWLPMALQRPCFLTELRLDNSGIMHTRECDSLLAALGTLVTLQSLHLEGIPSLRYGLPHNNLALCLPNLVNLRRLFIGRNQMYLTKKETIEMFKDLGKLRHLESINFPQYLPGVTKALSCLADSCPPALEELIVFTYHTPALSAIILRLIQQTGIKRINMNFRVDIEPTLEAAIRDTSRFEYLPVRNLDLAYLFDQRAARSQYTETIINLVVGMHKLRCRYRLPPELYQYILDEFLVPE